MIINHLDKINIMTEEQIQQQIEVIESVGRELSKSPEAARAFLKRIEERTGIKLKDKKPPKGKKENNK